MSRFRCQCPEQCDDDDPCFNDVTQEDFLCDWCRANCKPVAAAVSVTPDRTNR